MPSRKQRKRREKGFRHEYETVLIDEDGNEVPLDPDEARAAREERDKQRSSATKAKPAAKGRPPRPMKVPPEPSWNRAFKRGGTMGALILVLFLFVLKGGSTISRVAVPVFYAIAFIPLTYVIDRWSYRMYQKRIAKDK